MTKHLHIVCPEIPHPSSPADMADTYFQLQFLHESGYQIALHCFYDDADAEPQTAHLAHITSTIHLYARNHGHKAVSIRYPYCIASRSNPRLLQAILQLHCPVIFQGIASTFYLPALAARGYKTIVRINGIASELYEAFIKCEKSILKKAYSFNEARLIRKWEEKIAAHATIVTTTASDQQRFQALYKGSHTVYVAPFIDMPDIKSEPGTGMYCLYYGDMSNPENEHTVSWLSEHIFRKIPVPLVVADNCSGDKMQDMPQHPESNICRIANPAEAELKELIQKAQLILLPRCHNNGFDKRLLYAMEKGRFCICNDQMIDNTGLEHLFVVANGVDEMIHTIDRYFSRTFTDTDILERKELMLKYYNPRQSVHELLDLVEA